MPNYALTLITLLLATWLVHTAKSALEQVYIWQLKEYRVDRLRAHLATRRGRALLFNAVTLWKWALLILLIATWDFAVMGQFISYTLLLTYAIETIITLQQMMQRRLRRPQFTAKAVVILIGALGAAIGGMFIAYYVFFHYALLNFYYTAATALLLDRALFLIIAAIVAGLVLPTKLLKRRSIHAARAKMEQFPDLKVVGITGSYGKSSTKEFVYTILSASPARRTQVLKTPANTNTDIGVAQVVLRDLCPEHEVFVVEMGAYKQREIADICAIVAPQIGVLTAINEQHLALFKTIETTIATKFELIDALPPTGLAVLNADNDYIAARAQQVAARKVLYSVNGATDLVAENIIVGADQVEFEVKWGAARQHFAVNILGAHNVGNLLAAIAVALELEMSLPEIAAAAREITPPPGTMRAYTGINDTILIDDSYNANPAGVSAALDYLRARPASRRVIVTTGMLELGAATVEAHRAVGAAMARVCDLIVIVGADFAEHYLAGINDREKVILSANWRGAVKQLRKYIVPGDVILFEGRGTEHVLREVKRKT